MNFGPPKWVTEGANEALLDVSANHYSHPKGRIRLRNALKEHYSPTFNRELNADTEILITSGANEGESSQIDARYLLVCRSIRYVGRISRTRR